MQYSSIDEHPRTCYYIRVHNRNPQGAPGPDPGRKEKIMTKNTLGSQLDLTRLSQDSFVFTRVRHTISREAFDAAMDWGHFLDRASEAEYGAIIDTYIGKPLLTCDTVDLVKAIIRGSSYESLKGWTLDNFMTLLLKNASISIETSVPHSAH